jgi:hypothetical protein
MSNKQTKTIFLSYDPLCSEKAGVKPAPSRYDRDALFEVTLPYGIIQKI